MAKPKNEAAFPYPNTYEHGMSKRFYAACTAMQGMLANSEFMKEFAKTERFEAGIKKEEYFIKGCYAWADELLKQEYE